MAITVEELIQELQQFDAGAPVYIVPEWGKWEAMTIQSVVAAGEGELDYEVYLTIESLP